MNTIKLNTIGEGPAKAKAQEGGGSTPLVFDLTEYWSFDNNVTIPVTEEIIQAVLSHNIIFKVTEIVENDNYAGSVTKSQSVMDYSLANMENKQTGEYANIIDINDSSGFGLFGVSAYIDVTYKILQTSLPK